MNVEQSCALKKHLRNHMSKLNIIDVSQVVLEAY